jgi:hypothetical protein
LDLCLKTKKRLSAPRSPRKSEKWIGIAVLKRWSTFKSTLAHSYLNQSSSSKEYSSLVETLKNLKLRFACRLRIFTCNKRKSARKEWVKLIILRSTRATQGYPSQEISQAIA